MYNDLREADTADNEEPIGSTNRAPEVMQLLGDLPTSCPVSTHLQPKHSTATLFSLTRSRW